VALLGQLLKASAPAVLKCASSVEQKLLKQIFSKQPALCPTKSTEALVLTEAPCPNRLGDGVGDGGCCGTEDAGVGFRGPARRP